MKEPSKIVEQMKPSGIRRFFDLASSMEGVISLGVGEPDFDTPWHITEAGLYSLQHGKTHYTANRGLESLRKSIAGFHHEHYGQNYNPLDEVLVTVGGSEAVDLCVRALVNPGDEVIVLDPGYVAYEPMIEMAGATPVKITLSAENEFKLRPEDLKKALSDKTKALLINFPSNPTGGVMNHEDYSKLVDLIKESGIYVISDEIYAELTFEDRFSSLAEFPEIRDQVLVINGFSKAFAMTGWRLGYILSNKEISKLLTKIHQYTIMSAPTPAQYAAIEALENGYQDVLDMKEEYRMRRNLICSRLNKMGLKTHVPRGTFYVFPDLSRTGMSSEEFCEALLNEKKIAIVPGTAFGENGEGFARISYATSLNNIKTACDRIEEFLQEHDLIQD